MHHHSVPPTAPLGIPPPFPFCEEWPNLPRNSTRWLTPSFQVFPPSDGHPVSLSAAHSMPPAQQFPCSPGMQSEPNRAMEMHGGIEEGYESSEYEYGFVMTDEWAAHFARREKERRQTKKRTAVKAKKAKKVAPPVTDMSHLTYEVTIGQLSGKSLGLASARVDAMERRLEHAFMSEFSNSVTVCLYNA
ncbi:Aste57867_17764 [Aphanomyces stellatus]|uniref:Aste57867_17764 protein n=1 Tax=Aphanomyces stellatus TaxID=120398 RepID=A0A485L8H6_9STRA|nr:hypothetical protein As57867_017703 [Aphanomyces stellatus]VFT94510.1 Aste57867_17764 [Aphanomyces stellatus]